MSEEQALQKKIDDLAKAVAKSPKLSASEKWDLTYYLIDEDYANDRHTIVRFIELILR